MIKPDEALAQLCGELRDDPPRLKAVLLTQADEFAGQGMPVAAAALREAMSRLFGDSGMEWTELTNSLARFEAALSFHAGMLRHHPDPAVGAAALVALERLFPGSAIKYMVPGVASGDAFPPGWEPGTYLLTPRELN